MYARENESNVCSIHICVDIFALQHALLPFICRKNVSQQMLISIVWCRAQSQRLLVHSGKSVSCVHWVFIIYNENENGKEFCCVYSSHCCCCVFFVCIFSVILLHLFWVWTAFYHPILLFLFSFFGAVTFPFFYKCSGCEMRISCANVK